MPNRCQSLAGRYRGNTACAHAVMPPLCPCTLPSRSYGPVLSNVKIHFKLPRDQPIKLPAEDDPRLKFFSNFFTYRWSSLVFTVFHQNRQTRIHVNVSGLRHFDDHVSALRVFDSLFGTSTAASDDVVCRVDNSTASGHFRCEPGLNLRHLSHVDTTPFTVSIRPHFFPAALLRSRVEPTPSSHRRPRGRRSLRLQDGRPATAIVFSNGKYVIVGARSADHLQLTFRHLSHCIGEARQLQHVGDGGDGAPLLPRGRADE